MARSGWWRWPAAGLLLACAGTGGAGEVQDFVAAPSVNDYGGVGLLQTPTARFADDGEMVFGYSHVAPDNRLYAGLQLLPWLESGIRYTEVTNRLYGPASFSGDQTYKDRGLDFKVRLADEGKYGPALAVGVRDFGGTSLYGSEYLVASKRWYDWDFTLGLGWGMLGTRGDFGNPLGSLFGSGFDRRGTSAASPGTPGSASVGDLFHGADVALFGGIEYRTPLPGVSLKLEYDGNDYRHEPLNNNRVVDSPINVGVVYRPWEWLDLSLGVERGNTVMAAVTLRTNWQKGKEMPKIGQPPPKPAPRPPAGALDGAKLMDRLDEEGFTVEAVAGDDRNVTAYVSQERYRRAPQAVGRAARAIAEVAPGQVEALTVVGLDGGLETYRVSLMREDLERALAYRGSPEEIWHTATVAGPEETAAPATLTANPDRYPDFTWSVSPAWRQHMGGPDNFYFYQLWAKVQGELEVSRGLSVTGVLGFDLANNFSGLKLASDSVLPHVRSDVKQYLKEGTNGIPQLEGDYLWNIAPAWYGRLSAGLFEEMFGGVGGELLYRPYGSRWAVGADLNWVRQRGFDELFDFRDYDVVTGHASLYYELPWYGLQTTVSAGRYLAGDDGVTVDFSRRFANGVVAGAFATLTNVSAQQFGEGSFDKGLYLSLPLDLFFTKASRNYASFAWRPLTRDGGQRLGVGKRLYPYTQAATPGALSRDWSYLLE